MAYTRALAEHEGGHVQIALDNVPHVVDLMRRATCDSVDDAARAGANRIRQLEAEYETATDHGRTQGAIFQLAPAK